MSHHMTRAVRPPEWEAKSHVWRCARPTEVETMAGGTPWRRPPTSGLPPQSAYGLPAYDFANVRAQSDSLHFRPRGLTLGSTTDSSEHSADRAAAAAMLSDGASPSLLVGLEQDSSISVPAGGESASALALVAEVLRSPAQGLEPGTRSYFESRFGHDFSRVRVHSDSNAQASSRAIAARDYTVGHHIVLTGLRPSPTRRVALT